MDMDQLADFARDLQKHLGIKTEVVPGDPQSILQLGDAAVSFWFDFERGYVGCTGPDSGAHVPAHSVAVEIKPTVAEPVS